MATITAQATGNWSAAGTWTGGVLPGAGGATDDADSNGYTVTIDQDINLNGGALIGTSAGAGGFTVSSARTITANITATVRTVLTASHSSGATVTANGNLLGGTSASRYAINRTSTGRLDVVGDITGRNGIALFGGFASGIINLTGTITSPSVSGDNISVRLYTGTVAIVGNVVSSGSYGVYTAGATVTVTGNCTGSGNGTAFGVESGTVIVNGNCYQAATSGGAGIGTVGGGAASITINGNCYGNGFTSQFGGGLYLTNGSHAATINGNAVGGTGGGYGANNSGAGTVICNAAIAGSACAGLWGQSSSGATRCKTMQSHSNGMIPVYGFVKLIPDSTVNYAEFIRSDTGAALKLNWDHPVVGDVKTGITYDLGSKTGTMAGGAVSITPARGGGIG